MIWGRRRKEGRKRLAGAVMMLTGTLVCLAFLYGQALRI
jgi:hypothetical protein